MRLKTIRTAGTTELVDQREGATRSIPSREAQYSSYTEGKHDQDSHGRQVRLRIIMKAGVIDLAHNMVIMIDGSMCR